MRRVLPFLLFALLAATAYAAEPPPRAYLPLVQKAPDAPQSANELTLSAATYLGGSAAESASAIDIAPDGSIVLGGTFPGYAPAGITPVALNDGSSGAIIRLNSGGTQVLSLARIGTRVNDIEVGSDGAIIACGDFGIAELKPQGDALAWSANPGEGSRCAVGSDGTVAVIANSNVYLYDASGAALRTWSIGGNAQNDIAVDGASKTVIVGGYTQKDVSGFCQGQLQVAFVRGWNYSGQQTWKSYDWTAQQAEAASVCADTRSERVAIGRDGKLYIAGTINGGTGASIFARDPRDITKTLGATSNIANDAYNTAYNTGSIKMTWFGRYNPADGSLEIGSSLLTRLPPDKGNKGNSIVPRAISAASDGTVYLAGDTACCLPNRDKLTVTGAVIGPYEGNEGYIAVFSADLKTRLHWTALAGPAPKTAGSSPAVGIAVRGNSAAAAFSFNQTSSASRSLITANALQPTPSGTSDAYVAVWR